MKAPPILPQRSTRVVADVGALPTVTFGSGSMAWWGTIGFAVIEGLALVICAASYFYLRRNFVAWPPWGTPRPSLVVPGIGLLLMAVSIGPMMRACAHARRLALAPMRAWLLAGLVVKLAILVVRWYEFKALHTRWNSDAYGSITWITVGFHATLLFMDAAEDAGLLLILFGSDKVWERHFADVTDDAVYWYITIAVWVPLFAMIYLLPWWT